MVGLSPSRREWLGAFTAGLAPGNGWTLTGRTLDRSGRPVANALVQITETLSPAKSRRETQSGPRGMFRFDGLAWGAVYEVQARIGRAMSRTQRVTNSAKRIVLIELRLPI